MSKRLTHFTSASSVRELIMKFCRELPDGNAVNTSPFAIHIPAIGQDNAVYSIEVRPYEVFSYRYGHVEIIGQLSLLEIAISEAQYGRVS